MTATLQLSPLACWLIGIYQRYLSPRKGFRCAYRARNKRRASCSQFARRAMERVGVLPGVRLLQRRFDKCRRAKQVIDYGSPKPREERARQNSAGSATDCVSGCDPIPVDYCDGIGAAADVAGNLVSSVPDVGSCDAGVCDVGCCDFTP